MHFSTSLLREKFVISDARNESSENPVIALSNRMVVKLLDQNDRAIEIFIIRAQTMHTCLRMAAKIVQTYMRSGPLKVRAEKFDFAQAWDSIVHDYELLFNPKCWVSIYNSGKSIFSSNDYHAFFDVIENCEFKNKSDNYDASVLMAENIFAQNGKNVSIDYQAHTGMVLDVRKKQARCGLIQRSPLRRTNFNYVADERKQEPATINPVQCMTVAAAFLEGINLGFLIGRANERLRLGLIVKYSAEDKKAAASRDRMTRLNTEIKTFETMFDLRYRPERPEFPQIVMEAERFTKEQWEEENAELDEDLS